MARKWSTWSELVHQFLQYLLLGGAVKVDDHVAAEYDIRFLPQPIVGVHEIESTKLNQVPHLGSDSHLLQCSSRLRRKYFRRSSAGRGHDLGAEYRERWPSPARWCKGRWQSP